MIFVNVLGIAAVLITGYLINFLLHKMKIFSPEALVFVIFILIKQLLCTSYSVIDTTCYCLHEEIATLRNPVHIEPTIINGERVYLVAEQIGVIHEYHPETSVNKLKTFIDISDKVVCKHELYEERGLLGFALHPKLEDNDKIYTYTIRLINNKDHVVISEITKKDVTHEKILMLIEQPGDRRNGGQLLFGDDGFLYIFVGDGGPADDRDIQAQNGDSFLGKVLRIDVDKTTVVDNRYRFYDIPQDNPNRSDWRPEVYAVGTRNMWRCSKDSGDRQGKRKGRIFCGDLGSSLADELIELKKGANYGWPYFEGNLCRNSTMCQEIAAETMTPLYDFRRDDKSSQVIAVVGGPLYRGSLFPEIYGQLVYGDYTIGSTFALKEPSGNAIQSNWIPSDFTRCDKNMCPCEARASQRTMLLSFGQTHEGELLLLMTDEPTPNKRAGALFSLKPKLSTSVTCGVASSLPALWINILAYALISVFSPQRAFTVSHGNEVLKERLVISEARLVCAKCNGNKFKCRLTHMRLSYLKQTVSFT